MIIIFNTGSYSPRPPVGKGLEVDGNAAFLVSVGIVPKFQTCQPGYGSDHATMPSGTSPGSRAQPDTSPVARAMHVFADLAMWCANPNDSRTGCTAGRLRHPLREARSKK